ncbi:hypothetical protein DFQ30_007039 [Apophysomyces sp. BC1015]|nr:hypothetical protein DFQ30_007039 [Apophysomyces sp. BC1015]KAG0181467.1 hypothetical protein DFQ29_008249 [Apophysomyces sp. BC1021]
MEIDNETYPLHSVADYTRYLDSKPPEKSVKKEQKDAEVDDNEELSDATKHRLPCKRYTDEKTEYLFFLVCEKGCSASKAAKGLHNAPRTAQGWVKKDQETPSDEIKPRFSTKKTGRHPILNEAHREHFIKFLDDDLSAVLD